MMKKKKEFVEHQNESVNFENLNTFFFMAYLSIEKYLLNLKTLLTNWLIKRT